MAAAVVELDALPDPVGPAAQDHDPPLVRLLGRRLVFVLVGRVVVRRVGFEFGRTGIHRLERSHDPARLAVLANGHVAGLPQGGQLPVGESEPLGLAQHGIVDFRDVAVAAQPFFHFDDLGDLVQEPRVDPGQPVDLVDRHAGFDRIAQIPDPLEVGYRQFRADLLQRRLLGRSPQVSAVAPESEAANLQAAQRLLQRFLERPPNRHRLADALHLRRQRLVGVGEFFEGEPRDLGYDVIDRRLEAGLGLARDVVGQFVQPVTDRQFGRDLGDRKTGGLRGQRAGAADPRVHLDHHHPACLGLNRELDVRTARLDADLADHG